eukprot:5673730-Alexandrium_andersonii.AAC.1
MAVRVARRRPALGAVSAEVAAAVADVGNGSSWLGPTAHSPDPLASMSSLVQNPARGGCGA